MKTTPDVIEADFNRGRYPDLDMHYDYVVCSGLLEYVTDLDQLIGSLGGMANRALVTYAVRTTGQSRWKRVANKGWKTHLTQERLEMLLARYSSSFQIVGKWHSQLIYELFYGGEDHA